MAFSRIFDVDPNTKTHTTDDIVGRFRSGQQLNGRPMALTEWRITSSDPVVLADVATIMGGDEPGQWDTKSDEKHELFTTSDSVDVILDGPGAVRTNMVLWGRNGKVRECDGVTQAPVDGKEGQPCACPSALNDRKDAAKAGHGCEPSIQLYFRLADRPDLGKFKFFSGSWTMAKEIGNAEDALAKIDGPAIGTLTLVLVEYTTKAGKDVSFTKPVLTITGPYEGGE